MAYTSSGGVKTSTTIKGADIKFGKTPIEIIVQNQSTAVLYIKWGTGASSTDFDIALKACTAEKDGTSVPISLTGFDDDQIISAASTDLKYTISYR